MRLCGIRPVKPTDLFNISKPVQDVTTHVVKDSRSVKLLEIISDVYDRDYTVMWRQRGLVYLRRET